MIDEAVSNEMTFIDDRIISALLLCTVESRPSSIGVPVSTAIATVINDQVGEKPMSETVKRAAAQAESS